MVNVNCKKAGILCTLEYKKYNIVVDQHTPFNFVSHNFKAAAKQN